MNWYIGQPVIYLGNTVHGYVKNSEMVITAIRQQCHALVINADNKTIHQGFDSVCSACGTITGTSGDLLYFKETLFAPLMDISELESILKEETINK